MSFGDYEKGCGRSYCRLVLSKLAFDNYCHIYICVQCGLYFVHVECISKFLPTHVCFAFFSEWLCLSAQRISFKLRFMLACQMIQQVEGVKITSRKNNENQLNSM